MQNDVEKKTAGTEAQDPAGGGLGAPLGSDAWDLIVADHTRITLWRDAWKLAAANRKYPWLASVKEYIEARWDRANFRMGQIMQRADAYRASHPNDEMRDR